MKKIAFVFFGQVKNFDDKQYWSFEQNIGENLKGFDVDYFLVTSKSSFYYNPRQKSSEGTPIVIDHKSMHKYFNFKEVYYDQDQRRKDEDISSLSKEILEFGEAWKDGDALESIKKSLKQIYSLEYFINRIGDHINSYDSFILSRSDLFFTHPMKVDLTSNGPEVLVPYYNLCPQIDYGWFGGINDRFAVIKNKKALKVYCERFSKIKASPEFYHSEKYLLKQLQAGGIKYGKIENFMFLLQRADGSLSDFVGTEIETKMQFRLNNISKSYFINLNRRLDRLNHILINTPFFTERFHAVDGKDMQLNEEVKTLFPETWSSRSKPEICCALSHYRLWKKLSKDKESDNYLILEDDVVFKDSFVKLWNNKFSKQIPESYNLIYLGGCQPWNEPHYNNVLSKYNDYFCNIKENDFFSKGDNFWHMTTCSYIISKNAATLMCKYVEDFGMDEAVDFFMLRFFGENKFFKDPDSVFHLNPLMTGQLHEEGGNTGVDKKSDIRNSKDVFESLESNSRLIPKVIHQTWKDSSLQVELSNLWLERNEGYEYNFYNDSDIEQVIKQSFEKRVYECYKRLICGAAKADFFRYCILYLKGGIYCDVDFVPKVGFDEFICDDLEIIVCDDTFGLFNAFIASAPKSDFFLLLINKICDNIEAGRFRKGAFAIMKLSACRILADHFIEYFTKNRSPSIKRLILHHNVSVRGQDFIELNGKKLMECQRKLEPQIKQFNDEGHYTNIEYLYTEQACSIKKIIHQSWKTKDIPHSIYKKEWVDSWKQENPEWEYRLWTDEDNRNLVKKYYSQYLHLYDGYERSIAKADISRFFYMHKYGGLYADLDFKCLKSMDSIIKGEKINLGKQRMKDCTLAQNAVPNALIYSPPGDIFWIQCIEELKHHKYNKDGSLKNTECATGPVFLGKCIEKFKPKNLVIHDEHIFYPISWELDGSDYSNTVKKEWIDNPELQFPDSFAITYWSGGWRKEGDESNKKMVILSDDLFEEDFIDELFECIKYDKIFDPNMETVEEGSIIVYSDIFAKDLSLYPEKHRVFLSKRVEAIQEYFNKLRNCILVHLSDEHCHANIDHYKNFKHVFRQYYRKDAVADNVTFIPLGYKKGFNHEE